MSESGSDIPGADELVSYRSWVEGQPRIGRGILTVALFAIIIIAGSLVEFLRATLGAGLTQVVLWAVVLLTLYTLYGILRPSFAYIMQFIR